jgi:hypothetical protein
LLPDDLAGLVLVFLPELLFAPEDFAVPEGLFLAPEVFLLLPAIDYLYSP